MKLCLYLRRFDLIRSHKRPVSHGLVLPS